MIECDRINERISYEGVRERISNHRFMFYRSSVCHSYDVDDDDDDDHDDDGDDDDDDDK